jgi:hypothetical protein
MKLLYECWNKKEKVVPHRFQEAQAGNSSFLLLLFGDPYDEKQSVQSFHFDPKNLLFS